MKKRISKKEVEAMYKNEKQRPVELVFYNEGLRKSIGQRKPSKDLLKELDEDTSETINGETSDQENKSTI
ncbi:hypothetical protein ACFLZ5_11445 [Thermodesulfobacteriota bacterium]